MSSVFSDCCEPTTFLRKLVQFCSIIDTRSEPKSLLEPKSPLYEYLDRVEGLIQQGVCNDSNILFWGLVQSELGLGTKISYSGNNKSNQVYAKKIIDLIKPIMGQVKSIIAESDPRYFPHFMTQEKINKDYERDPSAFKKLKALQPLPLSTLIKKRNVMYGQLIFIDGNKDRAKYGMPGEFYDLEDLRLLEEVDIIHRNESGLEAIKPLKLEMAVDQDNDDKWDLIHPGETCDIETGIEKWEGNRIFWNFMTLNNDSINKAEILITKPIDSYDSNDLRFCKKISDELELEKEDSSIKFANPTIYTGNRAVAKKVVDILKCLIKDAKGMRDYLALEKARDS